MKTNQYSVTQRSRKIEHQRGSHGVSGIFFKYDLHPICVNVIEKHREFSQFLVRLCGIIGGVFATSGMLHSFIGFLSEILLKQLQHGKKKDDDGYVVVSGGAGSQLSAEVVDGIPSVSLVAPSSAGGGHQEVPLGAGLPPQHVTNDGTGGNPVLS